jgi:hypothetical protein
MRICSRAESCTYDALSVLAVANPQNLILH